jgi:uncharacterized protein YrzB (UPF0473 family)
MSKEIFTIQTENGAETATVLFTFDTDEHSYCIYTLLDEDGNEREGFFAARYELDENGEMECAPLESDEEWEMVQEVYYTLVDTFGEDTTKYFTVTDEEGNEILCEIIERFELEGFHYQYVLYKFAEEDSDLFAARYKADESGNIQDLYPIESDEEWEKIEQKIEHLS